MSAGAQLQSIERVRAAIGERPDHGGPTDLAAGAGRLMDAAGIGVSIGGDSPDGRVLSTVLASGVGHTVETAQATLGEGPSYTAYRTGRPTVVADLIGQRTWVLFGDVAEQLGIRAVFSFPLHSGPVSLGAISFYRRRAGGLTVSEHDDARTLAAISLEALTRTGGPSRHLALLAGEPAASEISQATGMVGAQLAVDMGTALTLLRARAIGEGLTLREVAQGVRAGHLHLEDDR